MYQKALRICETLDRELGTPGALWDLVVSHYHLGGFMETLGRDGEANAHYRKAYELCRSLAEECPQYSRHLETIRQACLSGGLDKRDHE